MVGYRHSGGHFKETGKGAPDRCLASPNPQSGERQQKARQREADEKH
jgi:hypothetical protein